MKKLFLLLSVLLLAPRLFAQVDSVVADPKDLKTPETIVAALYDVISGPAGQKRNWPRFRALFIPEAKMIPTGIKPDGSSVKRVMSVRDYIISSEGWLEKEGFFEKEIGRTAQQFGNIVQVFSTYESRKLASDEKPFMRGINSIQLWNDGKRWWIVNIIWQNESKEFPIPSKFLQH